MSWTFSSVLRSSELVHDGLPGGWGGGVHLLSSFIVTVCCGQQQLYQTLTDFDIRFYMYEILKVSLPSES